MSCDKVWLRIDRVRKPLEAPYTGPFTVLERSPKYFLLEKSKDVHIRVTVDRLKPFRQAQTTTTPRQNSENNNSQGSTDNESADTTNTDTNRTARSSTGRRITWRRDPEFIY